MGRLRISAFAAAGLSFALCMAAASPTSAAPLDPALQAQLLQMYNNFNRAIAAGKLDDAVSLRSNAIRQEMQPELSAPAKRQDLLQLLRMEIPDTIEARHAHLSADGASASILVIARKTTPKDAPPEGPPPGSVFTGELTLSFLKEAGVWKFDNILFGPDLTAVTACKNEAFEPIEAYDQSTNMSLGGPIVRVRFEADYTLVVVRVVDEENCAYLPNRAALEKAGVNVALLVPYNVVEIEGFAHKSDKQKAWGDHITVSDDY